MPASRSASPTPAPAKCTLWPRWTANRRCAPCWPCSRAWPRAPPTAMPAWPTNLPPPCCTWAAAWAMAWPTCTTRARARCPWSTSWATMPPPTRSTTPSCKATSKPWRTTYRRVLCAPRRAPLRCARTRWTPSPPPAAAGDATVQALAQVLRSGKKTALLLGGQALREPSLLAAARIAAHCGVQLLAEVFPTRLERGAGLPTVERIAYLAEMAGVQLAPIEHLILVDAKAPVSFFAYPGKKSYLVPDTCAVHELSTPAQDARASLDKLVQALGAAQAQPALQAPQRPDRPRGALTAPKVCKAVGHLLPENAILIDEAITSGLMLNVMTAGGPRHDLITLTGGAIGQGLPGPLGAAIAYPQRPVIALIGDGTAMYTIQALWTMAREGLNVAAIIFNNASYSVLNVELERVGAEEPGPKAKSQLDLKGPVLNFAQLAQGMGVHAVRTDAAEGFCKALEYALAHPGPHLIEAVVPESLSGAKRKVLPWLLRSLPSLPQPVARALKGKIAP